MAGKSGSCLQARGFHTVCAGPRAGTSRSIPGGEIPGFVSFVSFLRCAFLGGHLRPNTATFRFSVPAKRLPPHLCLKGHRIQPANLFLGSLTTLHGFQTLE